MTGILLLVVALAWIGICVCLSTVIARRLVGLRWRQLATFWLLAALLPLPLIDEIIGARQFAQACKENSTIQLDPQTARGRTVYLTKAPDSEMHGTLVRIVLKPWRFVDAMTGETVVRYNTLTAGGGRFIRAIGLSEGGVPLTFRGFCSPPQRPATIASFEKLGINYIERPAGRQ
jgi:hypothetical protein